MSAITAGITKNIKIPGFTGRGSISQVSRQISTKFYRGQITNIRFSTFLKVLTYENAYGVLKSIIDVVRNIFEFEKKRS